jgi:hypothetical protein
VCCFPLPLNPLGVSHRLLLCVRVFRVCVCVCVCMFSLSLRFHEPVRSLSFDLHTTQQCLSESVTPAPRRSTSWKDTPLVLPATWTATTSGALNVCICAPRSLTSHCSLFTLVCFPLVFFRLVGANEGCTWSLDMRSYYVSPHSVVDGMYLL